MPYENIPEEDFVHAWGGQCTPNEIVHKIKDYHL
jgi:hypothetical protein